MKTARVLLFVALSVFLVSAIMTVAKADGPRQDVLYSCNCGPECKCNSVSIKPGNCACGKPMKWGHVLKIEGTQAILCTCAEGCKCSLDQRTDEMRVRQSRKEGRPEGHRDLFL